MRSAALLVAACAVTGLTPVGSGGLLVSHHADLPTGPTVALAAAPEVRFAAAARRTPAALRRTVLPDLVGHV